MTLLLRPVGDRSGSSTDADAAVAAAAAAFADALHRPPRAIPDPALGQVKLPDDLGREASGEHAGRDVLRHHRVRADHDRRRWSRRASRRRSGRARRCSRSPPARGTSGAPGEPRAGRDRGSRRRARESVLSPIRTSCQASISAPSFMPTSSPIRRVAPGEPAASPGQRWPLTTKAVPDDERPSGTNFTLPKMRGWRPKLSAPDRRALTPPTRSALDVVGAPRATRCKAPCGRRSASAIAPPSTLRRSTRWRPRSAPRGSRARGTRRHRSRPRRTGGRRRSRPFISSAESAAQSKM